VLAGLLLSTVLSTASLQNAVEYSRSHGQGCLIVRQSGREVVAEFAPGMTRDTPVHVFSITKSLVGLAALTAEADGILRLDDKVSSVITEWQAEPSRRDVTVRELLSMTSGLATGNDAVYRRNLDNKAAAALKVPMVAARGNSFHYGGASGEVFEEFLARKLAGRGQTVPDYLQKRVLDPLGISLGAWRRDGGGRLFFSAGARLTPTQMVRVGDLLLHQGRSGFRRIFPARSWEQLVTSRQPTPFYRLGFWFNHNARLPGSVTLDIEQAIAETLPFATWKNANLCPQAPDDLIALIGSRGQRIYVVPSRRLVIVRLGDRKGFRDAEFLRRLFP